MSSFFLSHSNYVFLPLFSFDGLSHRISAVTPSIPFLFFSCALVQVHYFLISYCALGVEDNVYINFFGVESKAAMLACDACGKEFKMGPNDSNDVVLIRYTMHERLRQTKFHRLMGEKNRFIREGKISQRWAERKRITPDAPKAPKISKKKLQKALEAIDTSSDDDDRVDERGMLNPLVVLTPSPSEPTVNEHTLAPDEEAPLPEDSPAPRTIVEAPVRSQVVVVSGAEAPATYTVEELEGIQAGEHTTSEAPFTGPSETPLGGVNPQAFSDIDSLLRMPPASKVPVVKNPKGPPMPSLTRYPRSFETLATEVKELDASKKEMEKYSGRTPQQVKEYRKFKEAQEEEERAWKRHLAKLEARERHAFHRQSIEALMAKESFRERFMSKEGRNESRATSIFGGAPEEVHEERCDLAAEDTYGSVSLSAAKKLDAGASKREEESLKSDTKEEKKRKSKRKSEAKRMDDPHQRQLEATKRVALRHAEIVSNCYKKGVEVDGKEVSTMGTIAHWVKYEEMIGKAPPMEVRVKDSMIHKQNAEMALQSQRELEWEREKKLNNRLEHASVYAESEKEKMQRIRKEVSKTKSSLTEEKLKCVERSRDVDMRHRMAKNEEKHKKADDFNSRKYGDMAARRKFEHDQEELFRRRMKDSLLTMDMKKRHSAACPELLSSYRFSFLLFLEDLPKGDHTPPIFYHVSLLFIVKFSTFGLPHLAINDATIVLLKSYEEDDGDYHSYLRLGDSALERREEKLAGLFHKFAVMRTGIKHLSKVKLSKQISFFFPAYIRIGPPSTEFEELQSEVLNGVLVSPPAVRARFLGVPMVPARFTTALPSDSSSHFSSSARLSPSNTYGSLAEEDSDDDHDGRNKTSRMTAEHPICSRRVASLSAQKPVISAAVSSPVEIYIYDLSQGLMELYSEKILGRRISGVYHSSIVCYGVEFFFEGGINSTRAGLTRFGPKFYRLALGSTRVQLHQFIDWVEEVEGSQFQLHSYDLINWNCHHFTQKAVEFLLGSQASFPEFLMSTLNMVLQTDLGRAVSEILFVYSKSIQYTMVRKSLAKVDELRDGLVKLNAAAVRCRIDQLPPHAAVCFRVCDPEVCTKSIMQLKPFVDHLYRRGVLHGSVRSVPQEFAEQATSGLSTWSASVVQKYVDTVIACLLHTPLLYWGPLLNGLRLAILNRAALVICVYHPRMIPLVMLGIRDFFCMSTDGKIALARFVCNFSSSVHGAILLANMGLVLRWNCLVGYCLMDPSEAVRYTGACLSINLILSLRYCHRNNFLNEMCRESRFHVIFQITEVLLYAIHPSTRRNYSEPVVNMVLTAILHIKTINFCCLHFIDCHKLAPDYADLFRHCRTTHPAHDAALSRTWLFDMRLLKVRGELVV
eukprot:gene13294-9132_t